MVVGAEQHEAARPGHRLDLRPGPLSVPARCERLVHARLEPPQLSLEGARHFIEGLLRRHANMVNGDASGVHLSFLLAMGRKTTEGNYAAQHGGAHGHEECEYGPASWNRHRRP